MLEESESAAAAIIATRAEVVIVAFGSTPERRLVDVLRDCDRMRAEIFLIPRLYELIDSTGRDGDSIWGTPVIRLPRSSHRSRSWIWKRVFDLIFSVLAAIILLPVIAIAALATRLDLGPGVLFRQERVGLDGRPFEILKFRTVGLAADHDPETAWDADPGHVSRIGRTMRRLSLDELPQLWNVITGDMSLVGPRPERPHFVGKFSAEFPSYRHRHRVPCGMTGLAQVNGLRGDTSIESRARFDNAYIEGWSVSNDVKILLKTVSSVVRREGS